jgi:adenylosuccinate lyase
LKVTEKLKISREDSYKIIQKEAMDVWNNPGGADLRTRLESHSDLGEITKEDWDFVFNPLSFLENVNSIFERCKMP